jgi:hypothetical protein
MAAAWTFTAGGLRTVLNAAGQAVVPMIDAPGLMT